MNKSPMKSYHLTKNRLPPQDKLLDTKIDDDNGCRNEQHLVYHNNLWWHPDMKMYVYYTPTHWKLVD